MLLSESESSISYSSSSASSFFLGVTHCEFESLRSISGSCIEVGQAVVVADLVVHKLKRMWNLGGGCQMPLGALVEKIDHDTYLFRSMYAHENRIIKTRTTGKNLDEIIDKTLDELQI